MNRIDRLFAILLKISDGKLFRAETLAEEFELSERTIYRDMSALIEMGIPIDSDPGVGYQLREGYFLPPLLFEKDEAIAAGFALKFLTSYRSDSSGDSSRNALKKIESVLPKQVRSEYLRELEVLDFVPRSLEIPLSNEPFRQLVTAVKNQSVVDLEYITFRREAPELRQIEPVKLFFEPARNRWYLEAFCLVRKGWRLFRLDRIIRVTITKTTFLTRPREEKQYHPEPETVKTAVLYAEPNQARWIREQQHWSFRSEATDPDGTVALTYEGYDYTFINWLCTVNSYLLRIEPKELKEELRGKISDLQNLLT